MSKPSVSAGSRGPVSSGPVSLAAAVSRIRAWRVAKDWAPYRFSVEAGVPDASTRDMDAADWKPTLRTLEKLEAVIPSDWQPGLAVPVEKSAKAKARAA